MVDGGIADGCQPGVADRHVMHFAALAAPGAAPAGLELE